MQWQVLGYPRTANQKSRSVAFTFAASHMANKGNMETPKTLQQAIQHYSDEQVCIDAVAQMRWPKGIPVCPACGHKEHYYLKTQKRWKCRECYKQFTVKLGTVFEDSPISLTKWLPALWM